jgi:uncharacterized protein (DUF58 family)
MGRFPIEIVGLGKQVDILSRHADSGEESVGIGEGYLSLFGVLKGAGLEFRGYREYSPSDDSRNIDWKASMRSDKLLVKEYYQEKGIDVVFLYDVSESMLFGSQKKIKAHYGAEFILALAGTAIESNYNVGLVCFSDKIKKSFLPESGETQIPIFLNVLGDHSTYGGKFGLHTALEFINAIYNPGSIIVLVSDFLGDKFEVGKYRNKFKQITQRFDLISVVLRDPRDEVMPSQDMDIVVSSPYDDSKQVSFNVGKVRRRYEEYTKRQKGDLRKFLKDVNSEVLELYTNESFVERTLMFFRKRGGAALK